MMIPNSMYCIKMLINLGYSNDVIIKFLGCSRRSFFRWKKGSHRPISKFKVKFNDLKIELKKANKANLKFL